MRPSSFVPFLGGFVAGLVTYLAVAPQAQAAPMMGVDLGSEMLGLVDDMARTVVHGGMEGLQSVGVMLGLDPHRAAGPAECTDLRGVGFAFLGLAAVVIIAVGRMRLVHEQRRLDLARTFIEKGLEPPEGLLSAPARRDLRKGVVLVFAGLGLVVAGMMLGDRGMAAGGLIPAFIGIGYLVSHRLATPEPTEGRGSADRQVR
ncbi:MAG: hypothetical protein KDK70_10510 [Myxococcales bacterium]|nr:hypothetical protein [Myxococcales bacterium]